MASAGRPKRGPQSDLPLQPERLAVSRQHNLNDRSNADNAADTRGFADTLGRIIGQRFPDARLSTTKRENRGDLRQNPRVRSEGPPIPCVMTERGSGSRMPFEGGRRGLERPTAGVLPAESDDN